MIPAFNLFQWLALASLTVVGLRDLLQLRRSPTRWRVILPRFAIVFIAAILIISPATTTVWAHWLGIGRGADLVFYVYMLASLAAICLLYARCVRLERQITAIVRWEALHAAECQGTAPRDQASSVSSTTSPLSQMDSSSGAASPHDSSSLREES